MQTDICHEEISTHAHTVHEVHSTVYFNKSSAVAEMGDHLVTIDMG